MTESNLLENRLLIVHINIEGALESLMVITTHLYSLYLIKKIPSEYLCQQYHIASIHCTK